MICCYCNYSLDCDTTAQLSNYAQKLILYAFQLNGIRCITVYGSNQAMKSSSAESEDQLH